jgi:hypothetical protein
MSPVRCRATTVEKAGGRQQESARTQRNDPRSVGVRRSQGLQKVEWRHGVDLGPRWDDNSLGCREFVDPCLWFDDEAPDPNDVGTTETHVVPLIDPGRCLAAKDFDRDSKLEVQHAWDNRNGQRGHVRNCMPYVVPDTRPGEWAPQR